MNRLKQCRYGPMVYPVNDQFVGGSFEHYGEFSEGEVALFRCLLRPGATVLEVGANLGAHTVPLAQIVGPQGTVHAFEPQRHLYYFLCANVALNNLTNVICHQLAVGETAGSLAVPELDYTRTGNFGGLDLELVYAGDAYQVTVIRIDDLPLDRCDFIKIDVEGMEKRVLEGAVQTIARFKPCLYVEDDRADKSAALRGFLRRMGYDLYRHVPALYARDNFAQNPVNIFSNIGSKNLLCAHRASVGALQPSDFPPSEGIRGPFAWGCIEEGNDAEAEGRIDDAIAWFAHALVWQADFAPAHQNIGAALQKQGRLEEALASFLRALEIRPDRPEPLTGIAQLGDQLIAENNLDPALFCFQTILRYRPDDAAAHNNVGTVHGQRGHLDLAIASFQEAVRLQPGLVLAQQNLKLALARQAGHTS